MTDRIILSRRGLLRAGLTTGVAAASAALPIAAIAGVEPDIVAAEPRVLQQAQQPAALGGFTYFNTFQAEIVNAAAGRLIPTDANGPGVIEAGVVFFIDQLLSASYGLTGRRYEHPPYATGASTQGDQSGLDMRDRYRLGIQGMEDYAQQLYHTVHSDSPGQRPGRGPRILQRVPHQHRRRPGDRGFVLRRSGPGARTTGGPGRPWRVHAEQHPATSAVADRPAV